MRFRPAHLLLSGALLVGPLAACGGDDSKKDDTKTESTAKDTSTSDAGSGGNEELSQYCTDVQAYIDDLKPAVDKAVKDKDTTDLMAMQGRGQELQQRGEQLTKDLSESDEAQLRACGERLQQAAQDIQDEYSAR
jgi:hypothetical protein